MSRLGKTGRRALAAAVATFMMLAVAVAVPASAGAAGQGGSLGPSGVVAGTDGVFRSPIHQGIAEDGREVRATFTPVEFRINDAGELVADVLVQGVATGNGDAPERDSVIVENVPVQVNTTEGMGAGGPGVAGMSSHGCDILNLVLGPLDLNLLGLQIDLSQVVLDIVAQPGAGNLLGNLLCAVAGLLDSNPLDPVLAGLLVQLNDLLDQILGGLLGGLSL